MRRISEAQFARALSRDLCLRLKGPYLCLCGAIASQGRHVSNVWSGVVCLAQGVYPVPVISHGIACPTTLSEFDEFIVELKEDIFWKSIECVLHS